MSQVSKYPVSKQVADRIFEVFLKTIVRIKDEHQADQFISDLLTPTEKIMLGKRLGIAFLLEKGYDYRTIQKIIRVSAATIASVNIARLYGSEGYKRLIGTILREEKIIDLFEEAAHKVLSVSADLERGKGAWNYLKGKIEQRKKQKKRNSLW